MWVVSNKSFLNTLPMPTCLSQPHSLSQENQAVLYWKQSEFREISGWNPTTSGNSISPMFGTKLDPNSHPDSQVYQKLAPEPSGIMAAVLTSSPLYSCRISLGFLVISEKPTSWLGNGMPSIPQQFYEPLLKQYSVIYIFQFVISVISKNSSNQSYIRKEEPPLNLGFHPAQRKSLTAFTVKLVRE